MVKIIKSEMFIQLETFLIFHFFTEFIIIHGRLVWQCHQEDFGMIEKTQRRFLRAVFFKSKILGVDPNFESISPPTLLS